MTIYTIQLRRGTTTQWETVNPILAAGELGYDLSNGHFKMGRDSLRWNDLPYFLDEDTFLAKVKDYVDLMLVDLDPEEDNGTEEPGVVDIPSSFLSRIAAGPNTVALIGASITGMASSGGAGTQETSLNTSSFLSTGTFSWANVYLGHRMELVANRGIGGQRSDEILARIGEITSLDPKPKFCVIGDWWANNMIQNTRNTYEQIVSDGSAMISALNEAGITAVILDTIPVAYFNPAYYPMIAQIEEWIQNLNRFPGVIPVQQVHLLSQADGSYRTGFSYDTVHFNTPAGQASGLALADALAPHIVGSDFLAMHNGDYNTMTSNPWMSGTGGTLVARCAGSLAQNWTTYWFAENTSIYADLKKVGREDGVGEWQQVTLSGSNTGTANLYIGQSANVSASMPVGTKVQFEFEYEADNDWYNMTAFEAVLFTLGATPQKICYDLQAATNLVKMTAPDPGVLRTPTLVIPAGTTSLGGYVSLRGGRGTLRIGRARIKKVGV